MASAGAHAQSAPDAEPTTRRSVAIVPTFTTALTFTDNVHLTPGDRQSDLITQFSPGIQVTSDTGAVRGFLGYSLNALLYARSSRSNDVQHALNAAATVEAVEDRLFVDLAGNVSQRAVSAFGIQSRDPALDSGNRSAVSTYSISPHVRGPLGDFARYEARVGYSRLGSGTSAASDAATTEASAKIAGATGATPIGWSFDASHQSFDYDTPATVHSDRVRGTLSYAVTPELRVTVIGGRESQNFQSPQTQTHGTSGWGIDWTPIERTRLSVTREQRFFGNSHSVSLEHRTPRTVWRYLDSRDLVTGFDQIRLSRLGTLYDLFYAQFASIEPDPAARAILVNTFLQRNGIPADTVVVAGSLASAALVQRRQDLSFAWVGLRDTLTVAMSQSEGERADRVVVVSDDFAGGNVVRERGISVGLAHRLTPQSSLNVTASLQTTSGTVDSRYTRLRTLLVGWSGRLGLRTSASLAGRHARESASSGGYRESAVLASVTWQF